MRFRPDGRICCAHTARGNAAPRRPTKERRRPLLEIKSTGHAHSESVVPRDIRRRHLDGCGKLVKLTLGRIPSRIAVNSGTGDDMLYSRREVISTLMAAAAARGAS